MNLYLHHIGDFNNATRHLTRVERSVYSDAIDMYYDTEQALPCVDFDALARRLMCRSDEEKQALRDVLGEFFIKTDAGYTQSRCDEEIAKYRANTSAKARAGIASAAARQQKLTQAQHNLTDVEQTSTNRKPLTVNRKPLTKETKQKQATAKSQHFSLPENFCISDRVQRWADEKGHTQLPERLEQFIGYAKRNGKTYVDWDEALMGAIREDWAKLSQGKNYGQGGQQGTTGYISLGEQRTRTIEALTGRKRGSTIEGDSTAIFANEHVVR